MTSSASTILFAETARSRYLARPLHSNRGSIVHNNCSRTFGSHSDSRHLSRAPVHRQYFWRTVVRAKRPMHGRASYVTHVGRGLFKELPSPLCVGRYHSLVVELDRSSDPRLAVTARSEEGEIMALAHRHHPTFGVQLHPESILTERGYTLLLNFLRLAGISTKSEEQSFATTT